MNTMPKWPRTANRGGGGLRTSELSFKPAALSSSITRLAALTNFRFVTSLNISYWEGGVVELMSRPFPEY